MTSIRLPGRVEPLRLGAPLSSPGLADGAAPTSRIAYAAAHVVADPLADNTPGAAAVIDWDSTLAFREHLWAQGLGIADAMDTAQRGMGLDWPATRELIERSGAAARASGGRLVCGAGTDQLLGTTPTLPEVVAAYEEQVAVVDGAGAGVVLMGSRALAAAATGPEDYHLVYSAILAQVDRPVILHWLGPMFDPALTGYWGSADLDAATDSLLSIIAEHAARIDGVKMSLLDADREIDFRRRLPAGVRCYSGDDFNYPELIAGDEKGYSDALLGIFDPIAVAAAAALRALDAGDRAAYDRILAPTVALSRKCFEAPTYHYKTGVVFLAWLAGHQDHFTMVGGAQAGRSVPHLVDLFELADAAGVFPDPDLAAARMRDFLQLSAGFAG